MKRKLDRILLISLGFLIGWFGSITFHLFQSIPSDDESSFRIHPMLRRFGTKIQASVPQIRLPDVMTGYDEKEKREQFPLSIHREEWETIFHPAMEMLPPDRGRETAKVSMKVPKFWSPSMFKPDVRTYLGNYGEQLMTPEEAASIGSRTQMRFGARLDADRMTNEKYYLEEEVDAKDDKYYYKEGIEKERSFKAKDRVREVVNELETIFVAIASYRDYRCTHTIESVYARATYPERIRVAVVDQIDLENDDKCVMTEKPCDIDPSQTLCKYSNLIDVFEMNATLSVGPIFARHIGYRMYRGEYFAMQTDAHMEFINGWDADLISQWKSAENEMAVLTTYVSTVTDHFDTKTGESLVTKRPLMCDSIFNEDYYEDNIEVLAHDQQPEDEPEILGEPQIEPFWAAGFSFARGHFAVQVPYDQYLPMIFQGEEISIGMRGFSYGYDFYAPERSVLFHYYNNDVRGKKNAEVAKFWDNSKLYNDVGVESKARLAAIIQLLTPKKKGNETDGGETETTIRPWNSIDAKKYGIGKVRKVQKFYDTYGIHVQEKTTEKHLCEFVGEPMQNVIVPHLRANGMGIDYDEVTYRFRDPKINGDTWTDYYSASKENE